MTLRFLIFLQEQGVCLGVFRFLVISVRKFSRLSFKVCVCELCETQCICVVARVALARGARISAASRGDTGLWEESVPHRPSCIQLHHKLSSVLTVFLRRSS